MHALRPKERSLPHARRDTRTRLCMYVFAIKKKNRWEKLSLHASTCARQRRAMIDKAEIRSKRAAECHLPRFPLHSLISSVASWSVDRSNDRLGLAIHEGDRDRKICFCFATNTCWVLLPFSSSSCHLDRHLTSSHVSTSRMYSTLYIRDRTISWHSRDDENRYPTL